MQRVVWSAWSERLRAASDDGVIAVSEMVRLGVPERTAYRWAQHGGPIQKLAPGIMLLQSGAPSRRQKEIAALLHAGPGAMLTGMLACRHLTMRRGADTDHVHVLIPADRQVRSVAFVVVERTSRMPKPLERDGLPVAPLVRAVLDEARRHTDPTVIAALLAEPVQNRMVHPEALHLELEAGCRWGTAAVRPVVRAIVAGVRSPAEFDARTWWEEQPDLPPARYNVRVLGDDGRPVGVVDVLVEEIGLVVEIDSVQEHFATRDQVDATLRRRRRLHAVGLHVVSVRPAHRRDDPEGTLRDVLDGITVARALPPARVTYEDDMAPRGA